MANSHCTEGSNVKSEKGTAEYCDCSDEIYVSYLIHGEYSWMLTKGMKRQGIVGMIVLRGNERRDCIVVESR